MFNLITEQREVIERRTRALLLERSVLKPTEAELRGVSLLIEQLIDALRPGEPIIREDEVDRVAAEQGRRLFSRGFTAAELVLGYGAVCEVVVAVARERGLSVKAQDFEVLNRTIDVAIAGAVTGYLQRHSEEKRLKEAEHVGVLAHELRNALTGATAAFDVIKRGSVGISPRMSSVLESSLVRMRQLVDDALAEVRLQAESAPVPDRIRVAELLDQIVGMMQPEADRRRQTLDAVVPGELEIEADRQLLTSAVSNLAQNALKYSRAEGHVVVRAYRVADRVAIEVEDECGGLPDGKSEELFAPFVRGPTNHPGVGLGLSIVMRASKALGGDVRVRDLPGKGCIFSLELPRARDAVLETSTPASAL